MAVAHRLTLIEQRKVCSNEAFLELLDMVEPERLKKGMINHIKKHGLTHSERDLLSLIIDKVVLTEVKEEKIKMSKKSKMEMISK